MDGRLLQLRARMLWLTYKADKSLSKSQQSHSSCCRSCAKIHECPQTASEGNRVWNDGGCPGPAKPYNERFVKNCPNPGNQRLNYPNTRVLELDKEMASGLGKEMIQ